MNNMRNRDFDRYPPKEPVIIVLEDIGWDWYQAELDEVALLANEGLSDWAIARKLKKTRDKDEVRVALIHLERNGLLSRRVDFRLSA